MRLRLRIYYIICFFNVINYMGKCREMVNILIGMFDRSKDAHIHIVVLGRVNDMPIIAAAAAILLRHWTRASIGRTVCTRHKKIERKIEKSKKQTNRNTHTHEICVHKYLCFCSFTHLSIYIGRNYTFRMRVSFQLILYSHTKIHIRKIKFTYRFSIHIVNSSWLICLEKNTT